jgi:hypothetical protein
MPVLSDLLQTDFLNQAYWIVLKGYSTDQMLSILSLEYPGYSTQTLTAGLNRAIQGVSAGDQFQALQGDQSLFASDYPTNPNQPDRYQYVVQIDCQNTVSGIYYSHTLTIDSGVQMTKDEIDSQVDLIVQGGGPYAGWGGKMYEGQGNVICGTTIIFASKQS